MIRRWLYRILTEPVLPDSLRPETEVIVKWHQPLGEPVRTTPYSHAALHAGAVFEGEPDTLITGEQFPDDWWIDLSIPVWAVPPLPVAAMPHLALEIRDEDFGVPTIDRWHHSLSIPVWTLPPLPVAAIPSFEVDQDTLSEPDFGWFRASSEPVRLLAPLPVAAKQFLAFITEPEDFDVPTLDQWHHPLSRPVWSPDPLPVAAIPSVWDDIDHLAQVEDVFITAWDIPLAEPVRPIRFTPVTEFFFHDPTPVAEVVPDFGYFRNLSEPTRRPVALSDLPSFWVDINALSAPEETLVGKWHRPLSEPVRRPAALFELPSFWIDPEYLRGVPDFDYFRPLEVPVMVMPAQPAALHVAQHFDSVPIPTPVVTSIAGEATAAATAIWPSLIQ